MRLLLRRSVQEHKLLRWRTEFVLWARFELTDEERMLVRKYDMEKGYLTIEGSWRDLRRAGLYAFLRPYFSPTSLAQALPCIFSCCLAPMRSLPGLSMS